MNYWTLKLYKSHAQNIFGYITCFVHEVTHSHTHTGCQIITGLLLFAASCCAVPGAGLPRLYQRVKGNRETVHLAVSLLIRSLSGIDVYDDSNKVIMDDKGRSLLCSSTVCTPSHAHTLLFQPALVTRNAASPIGLARFPVSSIRSPLCHSGAKVPDVCCGAADVQGH